MKEAGKRQKANAREGSKESKTRNCTFTTIKWFLKPRIPVIKIPKMQGF